MNPAPIRAVLDTNVLVSALLFEKGRLRQRPGSFYVCWPIRSSGLQPVDRERLLEDLLPWCESWVSAIPSSQHRVRDPVDQVFLDLALAAATPVLVSGDADLLALKEEMPPCKSSTQPNFSVG